jgi:hypothetical protein
VDVENNTRREPVFPNSNGPLNSNGDTITKGSFLTLTFCNDGIVRGVTFRNLIDGEYFADYSTNILRIMNVGGTYAGDFGDGKKFDNIVRNVRFYNFKLYPESLHLFYNDGKECLEFKRIEGIYEIP